MSVGCIRVLLSVVTPTGRSRAPLSSRRSRGAYDEREVNAILGRSHDDVATLRRELVGYGFMTRTRNTYRVTSELPPRDARVAQEVPPDEHAWLTGLIEAARPDDSPV